jgi:hypothetical protein
MMGFIILFICEIFILGLIPEGTFSTYTNTQEISTPVTHSYFLTVIYNIQDLGWWNTLIFTPFLAFLVIFIIGLFPTVNLGD